MHVSVLAERHTEKNIERGRESNREIQRERVSYDCRTW